jgi:hypothetical protein
MALDIDPSLPEAQAALGVIAAVHDYNWKEADGYFRQAMARDPIPPHIRHTYGFWYLLAIGRPQDAATPNLICISRNRSGNPRMTTRQKISNIKPRSLKSIRYSIVRELYDGGTRREPQP